jgi:hypothetical protein
MDETASKSERGAGWLVFALAVVTVAAYLLVWRLLPGDDGCGPPGHSTAGRISEIAPFVIPFLSAGTLFAFGWKRRWRVPTISWGIITILVVGGVLEVVLLLLEIGIHNCTQ